MNNNSCFFRRISLFLIIPLLGFSTISNAQTSGGPDVFGYTWVDSDDLNGPTYNWVDITAVGTLVTGLADDNAVGPFSMPNFEYYGETVNEIKIGSNGWISFNNVVNISHCFPTIPSPGGTADNYLAPFMTDLNFSGGANPGEVYYYDDVANDRFIVSYINVPRWVNSNPDFLGSNTFQIILDRTDYSIYFQYNSMDATFVEVGGCSTDIVVGIENVDGLDGLQHSQEVLFQPSYAILFDSPYCKVSSSFAETSCDSLVSPSGNHTWMSSNTYIDTIQSVSGCDSIMTIDVTITNSAAGTDTRTECDSLVWIDGITYYANNNTATFNLAGQAANTCDSLVTLDLTINTLDLSVGQAGDDAMANETGATYQWLNCPAMTEIDGATSQTYTATVNGDYAVVITKNGCTDTSDCVSFLNVGISEEALLNGLSVYPNPTNGDFSIDLGENNPSVTIQITDLLGRVIQRNTYNEGQLLNLKLDAPKGVYMLIVESDNKKAVVRLVKK